MNSVGGWHPPGGHAQPSREHSSSSIVKKKKHNMFGAVTEMTQKVKQKMRNILGVVTEEDEIIKGQYIIEYIIS